MVRMHQTQFKFYINGNDNPRRPFNYCMMINIPTSSFNDGMESAKDANHLSSWAPLRWVHCSKQCFCKDINLCLGMCQQKFQAGFGNHEFPIAHKYIDEIVLPHVKPHVDNRTLTDSTVFMRVGQNLIQQGLGRTFLPVWTISCCHPRIQLLVSLRTYGWLCSDT